MHNTGTVFEIPFILDRNLAKANCTENRVFTSCDTVVLVLSRNFNKISIKHQSYPKFKIKLTQRN